MNGSGHFAGSVTFDSYLNGLVTISSGGSLSVNSAGGGPYISLYHVGVPEEFRFTNNGKFNLVDQTAGVTRLTVDASGNVGIGTTNPGQKLTVAGNASFGGGNFQGTAATFYGDGTNSTAPGQLVIQSNGVSNENQFIDFYKSGAVASSSLQNRIIAVGTGSFLGLTLQAWTGSAFRSDLNIDRATGNVGIGTTAPGATLDVNGNLAVSAANGKIWALNAGTNFLRLFNTGTNGVDLSSNTIQTFSTAGSERLRIDGSGNVGIGTAAPTGSGSTVLHIAGTGGGPSQYGSLSLSNASNSGNNYAGALDYYTQGNLISSIRSQVVGGGNTGTLNFYTANAGTLSRTALLSATGQFTTGVLAAGGNAAYGALDESLILQETNTGAGANSQISFRDYAGNNIGGIRSIYPGGTSTGSLAFLTSNSGALTE